MISLVTRAYLHLECGMSRVNTKKLFNLGEIRWMNHDERFGSVFELLRRSEMDAEIVFNDK